jgi:hypothetical protein
MGTVRISPPTDTSPPTGGITKISITTIDYDVMNEVKSKGYLGVSVSGDILQKT